MHRHEPGQGRPSLPALQVWAGALILVTTACGDTTADQTTTPIGATTATTVTSAPVDPAAYAVTVDVGHTYSLRVPGSGYILSEHDLDYRLTTEGPPGTEPAAAPTGTLTWAVRCYEDKFTPGEEPTEVWTGTHPARFEPSQESLSSRIAPEPGIDWTSGPATLVLLDAGTLTIVHQVASSVGLDRDVGCDPGDPYSAIVLSYGDASMRAPGRVMTGDGEFSRAEAWNQRHDDATYRLAPDGTGWIVHQVPIDAVTETPTPFSFTVDPGPEPEGGTTLTIEGTIARLP